MHIASKLFLCAILASTALTAGCKITRAAGRIATRIAENQSGTSSSTRANTPSTYHFAGTLEEGDTVRDDDGSFEDRFTISIDAQKTVTITMVAQDAAFDTYLIVGDPDGNEMGQNDDCTEGKPEIGSCVTFMTTKKGVYTVLANSYDAGQTGNYDVNITIQ